MLPDTYVPARRSGGSAEIHLAPDDAGAPEPRWLEVTSSSSAGVALDLADHSATARGDDVFDAIKALEAVLQRGAEGLVACGVCRWFRHTGLSRQMSHGAKGYCTRHAADHGRSLTDGVSVFDRCDEFERGGGT